MFNLMVARKRKEFTQKGLAEELGIDKNMIYKYEAGKAKPSIKVLLQLSKVLEVSTDYLLGNEVIKSE